MSRPVCVFRVVMYGPACAGKTTLVEGLDVVRTKQTSEAALRAYAVELQTSTIGVDLKVMRFAKNGSDFTIQLWDTAGQERFNAITSSYKYNCAMALIVVDFKALLDRMGDSAESAIPPLVKTVEDHIGKITRDSCYGSRDPPLSTLHNGPIVALVLNKTDLIPKDWTLREHQLKSALQDMCQRRRADLFETSAFYGHGVWELWTWMAKTLVRFYMDSTQCKDKAKPSEPVLIAPEMIRQQDTCAC